MSVTHPHTGDNPGRPDPLLPQHLADLTRSGLSDEQIRRCGFRSESDPSAVAELLGWKTPAKYLGPCLCIPFPAPDGKATRYVRVKPDRPRTLNGKTAKYESPRKAPNRAYLPPGTRAALADPSAPLLLTEGEKKAAKADQDGFPCVGLVGVWGWQSKRPAGADGRKAGPRVLIPDLAAVAWAGRSVSVVFDSDAADKPEVRWAEWHLAQTLQALGADVRAVRLPPGPGGAKVGLDDFLLAHGAGALRALLATARPVDRPETGAAPDVPAITIGTDEHRVNAEAAAALAAEPDLFQRGGMLVHVVEAKTDPESAAAVRRPDPTPVLRDLPNPLLRERLTRCARWLTYRGDDLVPAHPPDWCVSAVGARRDWPAVRRLESVISHPALLPDGSILAANGYDPGSRLLVCLPPGLAITVPDRPTPADVAAAVAALEDVVSDFPFETLAHRAAWLAGLLTPLAWFSFDGPAPLFLIDGNTRGVGKGLLADVIALTVTNRRFPAMSYTADREELRKRITTLAAEGDRLVLLDNLAGAVGNDVLDAALTADRWKDRLLGGNRVYDGPLHVCWYGTGNNVQLHADTARRVCYCRMETEDERPELKGGWRYDPLREHVRVNRGRLLSAALTVLRGWVAAGRPRHGLSPWGSFEGWSGVVREAVVFAGLPDPGETRAVLQASADLDALAMSAVLTGLGRMDPDRRGVTTAEVIDALKSPPDPPPDWQADLRSAVEELCGRLDGRTLGYRFRHFQRRNFGGRMLVKVATPHGSARWAVAPVGRPRAGPDDAHHPHHVHTPDPRPGGDGGHGGDVPARSPNTTPRRNGTPLELFPDQMLPD